MIGCCKPHSRQTRHILYSSPLKKSVPSIRLQMGVLNFCCLQIRPNTLWLYVLAKIAWRTGEKLYWSFGTPALLFGSPDSIVLAFRHKDSDKISEPFLALWLNCTAAHWSHWAPKRLATPSRQFLLGRSSIALRVCKIGFYYKTSLFSFLVASQQQVQSRW